MYSAKLDWHLYPAAVAAMDTEISYAIPAIDHDGLAIGSRSERAAQTLQRRSACDDCRKLDRLLRPPSHANFSVGARKVQCSGDVSGCQRCRRAGIRCFYSPPKPPGRPRKIRKVIEAASTNNNHHHHHQNFQLQQGLHFQSQSLHAQGHYFGNLYGGDLLAR